MTPTKIIFPEHTQIQKENKSLLIIGSKTYKQSTVNMLLEEGKKKFSNVIFVPIDKIQILSVDGKTELTYKDKNLLGFDAPG